MRWLVDCDEVDVSVVGEVQDAVVGSATSAPHTVVRDNGESLVEVGEHLPVWWVYSWLALARRPERLLLREGVVRRLVAASDALPDGFDLVVLDGWRPRPFQFELHDHYADEHGEGVTGYVADPDPESGAIPPHVTGGAVDLTLRWRGAPLGLGSDFDEFSPAATVVPEQPGTISERATQLRALLARVLGGAGFEPYPLEWWHWSYGDQLWAENGGHPHAVYGEVR